MLNLLHIENVAVIERADIEFGAGMNVFTGETRKTSNAGSFGSND